MAGFDITVAPSPAPKGKSKNSVEESIITESTGTMTDTMTTSNAELSDDTRYLLSKMRNYFFVC